MIFHATPHLRVLAVLLMLTSLAGCGIAKSVQKAKKLQQIGKHLKELHGAFMNYHDEHWGAPESWEHLHEAGLSSEARRVLEGAGYRVVLGVDMKEATIGTSNFLLACPLKPTDDRYLVLMMDGRISSAVPAEVQEFQNMQQPLLAEAVVLDPPAAPAALPPATVSNSPYVPPPPPPASGS
jgi:hypothetical protein